MHSRGFVASGSRKMDWKQKDGGCCISNRLIIAQSRASRSHSAANIRKRKVLRAVEATFDFGTTRRAVAGNYSLCWAPAGARPGRPRGCARVFQGGWGKASRFAPKRESDTGECLYCLEVRTVFFSSMEFEAVLESFRY